MKIILRLGKAVLLFSAIHFLFLYADSSIIFIFSFFLRLRASHSVTIKDVFFFFFLGRILVFHNIIYLITVPHPRRLYSLIKREKKPSISK